jgi:hypothetical protein
MRKALTIATSLSVALATAAGAHAQSSPVARIIAQEDNKGVAAATVQPSVVDRILAQERGRHNDPRLFEGADPAIVQVVGRADGFDWGDAGLGAGAAFALSLLAAGSFALRRASGYEAIRS